MGNWVGRQSSPTENPPLPLTELGLQTLKVEAHLRVLRPTTDVGGSVSVETTHLQVLPTEITYTVESVEVCGLEGVSRISTGPLTVCSSSGTEVGSGELHFAIHYDSATRTNYYIRRSARFELTSPGPTLSGYPSVTSGTATLECREITCGGSCRVEIEVRGNCDRLEPVVASLGGSLLVSGIPGLTTTGGESSSPTTPTSRVVLGTVESTRVESTGQHYYTITTTCHASTDGGRPGSLTITLNSRPISTTHYLTRVVELSAEVDILTCVWSSTPGLETHDPVVLQLVDVSQLEVLWEPPYVNRRSRRSHLDGTTPTGVPTW